MLTGDRLLLRAVARDDLPLLWQYNNDVEVELGSGGDPPLPQSLARLEAEYDRDAGQGGRNGMAFVIEADGSCIGQCALFNVNEVARTAELGITIGDKGYWNRGYGREAVTLLVDYGFRHHNFHKIWLEVHARNQRAVRAYQACGFVEEGRLRDHVWSDGAYDDLMMMGLLRGN